jgi:Mg2+ and Co2+ transporter CorA
MELLGAKPTIRDSWWLNAVGRFLSEAFMGFLALLALALAMVPLLFSISAPVERVFDFGEWVIVGVFALEYVVHLALARDRWRYVTYGWRLLDLLIIVGSLLSLLPQVSDDLRSAPVLRILRLFRAVAFGARASGVIVREQVRRTAASAERSPSAFLLRSGVGRRPLTWAELLIWLHQPDDGWREVSNVTEASLEEIASAVGVHRSLLDSNLFQASYPHAHKADRFLMLFLWYPNPRSASDIDRHGVLVLLGERGLISLSPQPIALQELVRIDSGTESSISAAFLVEILRSVLNANEELAGHFERELRALEEVPVPESRAEFLQQAFRLKRQLSMMQADLWRIRRVLDSLSTTTGVRTESLRGLRDESEYLYDTVSHIREGVLSLIELHINVVSFEMNKVMRVLAIVSALGLVPAVIGGLLGMNVEGNPWSITLPQVTFGVSMGMLLCLYVFYVRGWLR